MTQAELQKLLVNAVAASGGVDRFARRAGISNCLVSKTMRGLAEPDVAIASALGFVKRVDFVPQETELDRYLRIWA